MSWRQSPLSRAGPSDLADPPRCPDCNCQTLWLAGASCQSGTRSGHSSTPPSSSASASVNPLSYREVKTLIHNKKKAIFHCKTEGYNPNQDALHQLTRHQQTIIFRLRTGHCRLNGHLKRIGVKTSAQCPCGEADQTPEHYLQSCSLHQQARQQIWPTCVSLKTKLWGSAEDFAPDIQICGTRGRKNLVNATIISNAEEEEVNPLSGRQLPLGFGCHPSSVQSPGVLHYCRHQCKLWCRFP